MADTNIGDFSTTAASNTTVGGISIAEGMAAAQLNDAIRAALAVLAGADFGTKTVKTNTIAESTADTGVTVDGLVIKDGGFPSAVLATLFPDTDFSGLAMTGDYKETSRSTADTGWLMCSGETLGSAASEADQASDDNEALFLHLWDGFDNAQLPVTGGRGASAEADWAANKIIALPNRNNRMGVGAGDTYVNGETGGAATVTLTQAQLPNVRLHNFTTQETSDSSPTALTSSLAPTRSNTDTANTGYIMNGSGTEPTVGRTSALGSGQAHNNLPPYFAAYWQIKL